MALDKGKIFSIVIPCFNEKEGLSHLFLKLRSFEERFTEPHELVFVDDGSADSTYEELKAHYRERLARNVKIIKHPENRGVGAAIRTGFANSDGEYIGAIDSDCTYEPDYLIEMLSVMKKEGADIITASPYHPEGKVINVPAYRLFLSKGLSKIYNIISGSKFYTYTSMFRIYRKDSMQEIDVKSDGFLAMAEILIKAHRNGLKILEYPATLAGRKYGVSNAKIFELIKEHLWFIVSIILKRKGRAW